MKKGPIQKDYKTNEGLYVIHHTLDALYQKFSGTIPKKIDKQLYHLIIETLNAIANPKEIKGYEIINEDYIWRVTYDIDTVKKKKNRKDVF